MERAAEQLVACEGELVEVSLSAAGSRSGESAEGELGDWRRSAMAVRALCVVWGWRQQQAVAALGCGAWAGG